MSKWSERLVIVKEWFNSDRKIKLLVVCGLGLIVLLFLWGLVPEPSDTIAAETSFSAISYQKELEAQTKNLLEEIEGVGKLSVMITLEQDYEVIYQTDDNTKTQQTENDWVEEQQKQVVLSDKMALIQTTKTPAVLGVAVVCQGGDEAVVQQRITETVTTLFGIGSSKVSVVTGQTMN